MAKFKKTLDQIINFIKSYSVHFAMIIPFTVILLNLTQGVSISGANLILSQSNCKAE